MSNLEDLGNSLRRFLLGCLWLLCWRELFLYICIGSACQPCALQRSHCGLCLPLSLLYGVFNGSKSLVSEQSDSNCLLVLLSNMNLFTFSSFVGLSVPFGDFNLSGCFCCFCFLLRSLCDITSIRLSSPTEAYNSIWCNRIHDAQLHSEPLSH